MMVDGDFDAHQDRSFRGISWNSNPNSFGDNDLVIGGFDGSMDEVAIYDRALSVAEIRADYLASGLPAPSSWNVPANADGREIYGPNGSKDYGDLLRCHCGDPVDTGSGNLHMPIPSVMVPGRGPGLDVSMAYNSLGARVWSSMGYGWSSTLDMHVEEDSVREIKTVVQETGATVPFARGSGGAYSAPEGFTATLTPISGTTDWLFTRQHTEKFRFDQAGRLVAISDQYGNTTTVTYWSDTAGAYGFRKVKRYTDAGGRYLEVTWNSATSLYRGLVASIAEPAISGEAPYLAARLQAAAEPGTVAIADATRRLLGRRFIRHRHHQLAHVGVGHLEDVGAVGFRAAALLRVGLDLRLRCSGWVMPCGCVAVAASRVGLREGLDRRRGPGSGGLSERGWGDAGFCVRA